MKNVTISLDDRMLDTSRAYAERHHTTLHTLIRNLLDKTTGENQPASGLQSFIEMSRQIEGHSAGQSWTRDEIHERRQP